MTSPTSKSISPYISVTVSSCGSMRLYTARGSSAKSLLVTGGRFDIKLIPYFVVPATSLYSAAGGETKVHFGCQERICVLNQLGQFKSTNCRSSNSSGYDLQATEKITACMYGSVQRHRGIRGTIRASGITRHQTDTKK